MTVHDLRLKQRLDLVRQNLERDFPAVPPKKLEDRLARVVSQLVADARVLDFVPVLAERFTRDWLTSGGAEAHAEGRAA